MSASLVGSEMCIRDRCETRKTAALGGAARDAFWAVQLCGFKTLLGQLSCLLYTSDAADDM
eukprot:14346580-Alexandrium_andersonii.AAC.1